MSLIHLVYVSTARAELSQPELRRILAASARNNVPVEVTGMLLYSGGCFMQVLEGEEAAVDGVYGRIAADPRHKDVTVLERAPIEARSFPTWTMGFRQLGTGDAADHPSYAPFFAHGFDPRVLGARPGLALDLLREFGANQRD